MQIIVVGPTLLAFCFYLLAGFAATRVHAGEYYIYQESKGGLVISNQKPPPGSKMIKQQSLPDTAEGETVQVQEGETPPNGNAKPSKPSDKK